MRKQGCDSAVASTLTVYHDGQFWVGIAERQTACGIEACRIVFGKEPTNEEVYQFVLDRWDALEFSAAVESERTERHRINPKRRQREASREAERARPSTKAQEALARERESRKSQAASTRSKQKHRQAQDRFNLRKEKAKQRHRGH